MTGGKTLGSGVVQSAANNIANFNRAGVWSSSTKSSKYCFFLQDISSNIISNVETLLVVLQM